MKGKYYGVYDMRDEDRCLGVFESTDEMCAFFGGIKRGRIWCAISRKNPLTFKAKRYWVEVFTEPTRNSVKKLLRQQYGPKKYRFRPEGIYIRDSVEQDWKFFTDDYEEATAMLCE